MGFRSLPKGAKKNATICCACNWLYDFVWWSNCDCCTKWWHWNCISNPEDVVPSAEWICPKCQPYQNSSSFESSQLDTSNINSLQVSNSQLPPELPDSQAFPELPSSQASSELFNSHLPVEQPKLQPTSDSIRSELPLEQTEDPFKDLIANHLSAMSDKKKVSLIPWEHEIRHRLEILKDRENKLDPNHFSVEPWDQTSWNKVSIVSPIHSSHTQIISFIDPSGRRCAYIVEDLQDLFSSSEWQQANPNLPLAQISEQFHKMGCSYDATEIFHLIAKVKSLMVVFRLLESTKMIATKFSSNLFDRWDSPGISILTTF